MEKYLIVLRNEKAKTYPVISWLIVILNIVAFLYFGISRSLNIISIPFIAAFLLILIAIWLLAINIESKIANNKFRILFAIIIIAWIIPLYWAAFINLLLFLIQDIATRSLEVTFFEDRIIYPSFPKRTISWKQLNNVILKDGILTIDFKNNRLHQNEIISNTNEPGFNDFCKQQLKISTSI